MGAVCREGSTETMLKLLLLLALPYLVCSAACGGKKKKRSVNDYSESPTNVYDYEYNYPSLDDVYHYSYGNSPWFQNRYNNFLAGQQLYGHHLGWSYPRFDAYQAYKSDYMDDMLYYGNYYGYDANRAKGNNVWKKYGYALFGDKADRKKRSTDYGYGGYGHGGYGGHGHGGYGGYSGYGHGGYGGYGGYGRIGYSGYGSYPFLGHYNSPGYGYHGYGGYGSYGGYY